MSATAEKFVAQRAETLGREFLTRSPAVELHDFRGDDLDFILTLVPKPTSKSPGFMAFGAVVKGTERDLDERAAAAYLATHLRNPRLKRTPTRYFIPTLAVVFAMKDNSGYYAWLAEPGVQEGRPVLHSAERLDCKRIDQTTLDEVIAVVRSWYDELADVMLVRE